jgi:hypothetical protein
MHPLFLGLAADSIPVAVTCRVLGPAAARVGLEISAVGKFLIDVTD